MLSRFSVKKPFTIFVVVVLILVFGAVSVVKSTMDLFPKIDLPYVLVLTTYPGAAPEKVEETLTIPIEGKLATLDDLKSITSSSNDNYSLVMLEFNDDAELGMISSDIRDKIELISASFPDDVGNPTIMKINPNMIPTMSIGITYDGKDTVETSTYYKEEVEQKLLGVSGVASVSTGGLIQNTVHITLDQDKIDSLNSRVSSAALGKLDDAQKGIDKGLSSLESGKADIEKAKSQIKEAQNELSTNQIIIEKLFDTLNQLLVTEEQLSSSGFSLPDYLAQIAAQKAAIIGQLQVYNTSFQMFGIDLEQATVSSLALAEASSKYQIALKMSETQLENQLAELIGTEAYMNATIDSLNSSKTQLDSQRKTVSNSADMSSILTVNGITQILSAQNFEMPAGYISGDDGKDMLVTVGDAVESLDDLRNLPLFDVSVGNIGVVRLGDVATVSYMNDSGDTYAKLNGKDGVLLSVGKQSDYGTTEVADNVLEKLAELEAQDSKLHFTVLSNQGSYIKVALDSVLDNLLIGAILAILILFLFLRDIRPTIITALSIPISVMFAFVLMYFSGVTLNIISLAGLAVGIGMLVDNSIVVVENIFRLRSLGYSKKEAAMQGASQVAVAITASTLTTICVFLPIVFLEGLTKQLFVDIALTITYSLVASLIIALTLVPAMGGWLFSKVNYQKALLNKDSKIICKYKKAVTWALAHKALVMILSFVLLFGTIGGCVAKGFEYMPSMASEEISGSITLPKDMEKEDCFEIYDEINKKIMAVDGVNSCGIILTGDSTASMLGLSASQKDYTKAQMYILMDSKKLKNASQIKSEMDEYTKDTDVDVMLSTDMDITSYMGGSDITLYVKSNDLDDMRIAAVAIEDEMRNIDGLEEVSDCTEGTVSELHISVKKEAAAQKGLTVAQVYTGISSLLTANRSAGSMTITGSTIDILISGSDHSSMTKEALLAKSIAVTSNGSTQYFKVSDLANVSDDASLSAISHIEQERCVSVKAKIAEGYNTTKMQSKIMKQIDKLDLPDSVKIESKGENETIMDALKQLLLMLALAVLLIYLIMVAQFQSLKMPFIVMFTVPLAFTGGLLALLITNGCISVVSMIGFVMLSGVIVNNGIVLIDYVNRLISEGMSKEEALVEAGATRMRPILMTAVTTILGLLPLAIGIGQGAEMIQPVAIVCIGGMLYATLMTLFVVPVMYATFIKKKKNIIQETVDENDIKMI